MSRDELLLYEASLKAYRDNYSAFEAARLEGEVKGEVKKAIEIARNMKQEGFDPAIIEKMTGLSPEEIERLQ